LGFGLEIDRTLRSLNLIPLNDTAMTFVNNGKHSLQQVSDMSTIDANKDSIHDRPELALNRPPDPALYGRGVTGLPTERL
jgi:hypothetical protein